MSSSAAVTPTDPAAPIWTLARSFMSWSGRSLFFSAAMFAWLLIVLLMLAYILPAGVADDEFLPVRKGVFSALPLNMLLGTITVVYFACVLPALLLPMNEDQRFTWFLHVAFGWMACLLGSVAWLYSLDFLRVDAISLAYGWRALALILAGVFATPMMICLLITIETRRRLTAIASLFAGWILMQLAVVAVLRFSNSQPADVIVPIHNTDWVKVAAPLAALLYVAMAMAVTVPTTPKAKREAAGFLGLVWCFLLALVLLYQLINGHIALLTEQKYYLSDTLAARVLSCLATDAQAIPLALSEFVCVSLTAFIAPFIAWLGMPWLEGRRVSVGMAMLAGATIILFFVCRSFSFSDGLTIFPHLWQSYDGPHLLPNDLADWVRGQ